jgi:hypothetical protein
VFNNFLDIILIMGITHRWQTLLQKVLWWRKNPI